MTYLTEDVDVHNESVLEAQEGDFYTFLEKEDWAQAQAIIDNLWDLGKDVKAEELRRAYLRAQTEVSTRNGWEKSKTPGVGRAGMTYYATNHNEGHISPAFDTPSELNEWVERFAPQDNPLNGVKVERVDLISAKRMMDDIVYGDSELNPNRGDAPY